MLLNHIFFLDVGSLLEIEYTTRTVGRVSADSAYAFFIEIFKRSEGGS